MAGEAEVVVRGEDEHLAAPSIWTTGPCGDCEREERLYVRASRSPSSSRAELRQVLHAGRRGHSRRPLAGSRREDDLAGLARLEQRERLLVVLERQLVR